MFVVAITRLARAAEEEAAPLAAWFDGVLAYEMRLRLSAPLPILFTREEGPDRAREILGKLRERGHGAIACDESFVSRASSMFTPKHYRFEETRLVLTEPPHESEILYAEIAALMRAGSVEVEQRSETQSKKKFDMGRAVLTGGLMLRKNVTTDRQLAAEEREEVLYVMRKDGRDPILFRQGRLHHEGLGAEVAKTSLANFHLLVSALRARAPHAFYDERLLTRRRAATMQQVGGTSAARVVSSSNASENDLAVHLLLMAHFKGEL